MARVVVDATVIIAARLQRDQNHDRATAVTDAIDRVDLPTAYVFTDVLQEVADYLSARASHDAATRTLDAIVESTGFEIAHPSRQEFDAVRTVFRQYESLSLTDALIAAAMGTRNIDVLYSFDDGFDALDSITRLTAPEYPDR